MIIAIIILSVLLVISLYVLVNLMLKVEKLEDVASEYMEDYTKLSNDVKKVSSIITQADVRGSFAADDEVGEAFKTIKQAVKELEENVWVQ